MKRLFTLVFLLICILTKAQTLHKVYSINYSNAGDCALNTLTYGGALYYCYVEDTLSMPSGKSGLVLQKNDLNGNPIWKKIYRLNPSVFAQPVKMVALGSSIYIGGVYGSAGFLTSIDSTAGAVNYFNTYPPFSGVSSVAIRDIAILNNNEIVAVGDANGSSTGIYMYVLRANALSGTTITSGINILNDQRAMGVCCLNNSIYIVGSNASYPFITKLRVSGSGYIPVATRMYSSGVTIVSSFQRIFCNNSTMVALGSVNNSPFRNVLVKIDTNITVGSGPLIATMSPGNSVQFHNMVLDGNNTIVSGLFNSMYGVARYDLNLNLVASNTYSTFGQMSQIQYINNNTYFTLGQGFTFSNIKLMKGNNNGITVCSFSQTPNLTFLTMTNTVLTTSLSVTNSVVALSPVTYTIPVSFTTTCLSTDVKEMAQSDVPVKLLSGIDHYEIVSEETAINEVSVFDLTGKVIIRNNAVKQQNFKIDLGQYNQGLYFINVKLDNKQTRTFKAVKQ